MKGRSEFALIGFLILLPIVFTLITNMASHFNSTNSTFDIFNNNHNNQNTQINTSVEQTIIHQIQLRTGKILYCEKYEQTPCGLKLTKCLNNATYTCITNARILV